MINSHAGHDCTIANHCIIANGVLLAGHVQLNDHVTIGGNSGLHQFIRIGRFAMLAGVSGITQDIPPFCVLFHNGSIGALNRVGLKRNNLADHIDPLKQAFKILYRSHLPPKIAAQKILDQLADDPLCVEFAQFVLDTKRGIVPNTKRFKSAE